MAGRQLEDYVMTYFNPDLSALDRFNIISRLVCQDEVAVSLLEKLISSAEHYFSKVVEMETRVRLARLRIDGEELRELTEVLDKNRTMAHEALISDLHVFNRYLMKNYEDAPVGGIFSKDPDAIRNRVAVADWAGELLAAIYQERRK
ncbi:uncharacterized protein DUF3232 [Geothermobacter ehrlichii]|uniref:Uncharacterized protein DUF3232 n=1 Tax=Geothermobacter ehrlichii TaxID=213224 RepID=A0A5D3WGS8_9BACT|nr:DUF3232 domain-containing protein [Geothermobacter ehrlichii]TYO96745.1 uncharacterized protein DUF3232 [Geothermobacter ehrlichii]